MTIKKRKHKTVSVQSHKKLEELAILFKRPQTEILDDMIYYFYEIKTDPKDYKGFRDLFARWTKNQEKKLLYPLKEQSEKNAESLSYMNKKIDNMYKLLDSLTE